MMANGSGDGRIKYAKGDAATREKRLDDLKIETHYVRALDELREVSNVLQGPWLMLVGHAHVSRALGYGARAVHLGAV